MKNAITKKLFIEDNSLVAENAGTGISRKLITYDERLMLVKVEFEKGAVGAIHHHEHTQVSYIERGEFEVVINEDKKVLRAGSSFYVPPNAPHGVVCLEAGVLLDMFSPMREDFLPR